MAVRLAVFDTSTNNPGISGAGSSTAVGSGPITVDSGEDVTVSGAGSINVGASGTVAGITSGNLVDKSASETIAGDWTFSGTIDVSGGDIDLPTDSVDEDNLNVGSAANQIDTTSIPRDTGWTPSNYTPGGGSGITAELQGIDTAIGNVSAGVVFKGPQYSPDQFDDTDGVRAGQALKFPANATTGDRIVTYDGTTTRTYIAGTEFSIGATIDDTIDNIVAAINGDGSKVVATRAANFPGLDNTNNIMVISADDGDSTHETYANNGSGQPWNNNAANQPEYIDDPMGESDDAVDLPVAQQSTTNFSSPVAQGTLAEGWTYVVRSNGEWQRWDNTDDEWTVIAISPTDYYQGGDGISIDTTATPDAIEVDLATNSGLTFSSSQLTVNLDGGTMQLGASGLSIDLTNANTWTGQQTFDAGAVIPNGDTLDVNGTIDVVQDGFQIGSVAVTTTAAELNILDGALLDTAELNTLNGITATTAQLNEAGTFFGSTDMTGSEAEELTDGSTTSLHQHNLADGAVDVTSTAAELNKLDGVTSVTADFNLLSGQASGGLTGADLTKLGEIDATSTEIDQVNDGVSANVTAANLNTLTGGGGTSLHTHSLSVGATDVTATAAELNKLDGASANVTPTNLNTLTAGASSDADALHTHDTLQDNVVTTQGDIIRGDASGDAERLGLGTTGQVLTVVAGQAAWSTPAAVGDAFTTINCPAGTDPVADSSTDTLNLTSSGGTLTITGNSTTDTVNFDVTANSIGATEIDETDDYTWSGAQNFGSATVSGLSTDDLSDVASIAMLDEDETVSGNYTFSNDVTLGSGGFTGVEGQGFAFTLTETVVSGDLVTYTGSGSVKKAIGDTEINCNAVFIMVEAGSAAQQKKAIWAGSASVNLETGQGASVSAGKKCYISTTQAGKGTATPPSSLVSKVVGIFSGSVSGDVAEVFAAGGEPAVTFVA